MDFGHDGTRMHVEGDRLSSLPDDLIHKILSFISIKHAMETSVLSSRWRLIWTTIPHLNFSSWDFRTLSKFSKFVDHVLSGHNNQTELSSVKLTFHGKINHGFVKRIIDYAFSHNAQQLTVTCLLEKDVEFPLSIFNSQSLKHLTLSSKTRKFGRSFILPTSTWELPALTTLHLHNVALCDNDNSLFSKCANLKSLTINNCSLVKLNSIRICHPLLSDLTLENDRYLQGKVMVVAPQLKNLTISWSRELLISAPKLVSFLFTGSRPLLLATDGFCNLEKADLCIYSLHNEDAPIIVYLLEQLQSVRFFTLNMEIVEFLSSKVKLISDQPSPFSNLKSLKIYPANAHLKNAPDISTEAKNYLLDGSPSATCTMVSREETRAMKNAVSAQKLITELRVLLDCEKANSNRAHVEGDKAPMENQTSQPHTESRLKQIGSCLEDLSRQVKERETKACQIVSKLDDFERLLTKLPASKKSKIIECFYGLCAEADTFIYKTIDGMKFQCDDQRSRVSGYFHQLSTASQLTP